MRQQDLARRAGLSIRAVRDLEQDRVRHPQPQSLQRLVAALRLSETDRRDLLATVGLTTAATDHGRLRISVLGPLLVQRGDVPVAVSQGMLRALLGLLALQPGRVVPREELIDALWGEDPPNSCLALLHTYVARLRELLESGRPRRAPGRILVRMPGGYQLEVGADQLDVLWFEQLVDRGQRARTDGDPATACALLAEALTLWRGPVLADLGPLRQHPAAVALGQRRLAAALAHAELAIDLGRGEEAVTPLQALIHQEPLHEGLHAGLMLALASCGQQAAALRLFVDLRARLAEELGVEPGSELQQAHLRVLRQQLPAPDPSASSPGRSPGTIDVPCQLPPDIDDFTGREAATAEVQQLLEGQQTTAIVISAIAGKAGVGKTALAVHVAHRLRPWFPDGQLYVNLRGAEAQARDPSEVLAEFLRALGMEGTMILDGLEERARQFRTRLADRRVLVVLDNAANEAQLRPLLPGSGGCVALVTSRARLGGLEAAHSLTLEVLDPEEAVALLAKLAGPARVAAEPQAAQAIVRLCGWLPLAVRIAGARLAARPQWRLALLAQRLSNEHRRLDELTVGDLEVRASIALSYHGSSQEQRRLFRLLGLLVVPSFTAWVAAALMDTEPVEAEALLEGLVDAQLIEAAGQDEAGQLRYRLHDLLRVYARERLLDQEPAPERQAALQRMLQGYLTLAERADALLVPSGLHRFGSDPAARPHTDHSAATIVDRDPMAWCNAERASLGAAVEQACQAPMGRLGWRLADALGGFLQLQAHLDDWQHTRTLALAATRRAGDRDAEARIVAGLSDLYAERDRVDDARRCLRQGLAAFRETSNRHGELQCLANLSAADLHQGRFTEAIARLERTLAGFRELGLRSWEAFALYLLGSAHHQQGRLAVAVACLSQSLTLIHAVADHAWEAAILRRLGLVHSQQGQLDEAVACLQQSLVLARAAGERLGQAYILQSVGELYLKQGRLEDTVGCLLQSLALVRALGDRDAEARAMHTLGEVRRRQGRLKEAAGCLERSLLVFRDLGYRHSEARVLNSLGLLLATRGDRNAARSAWRDALAIFRELDMPEAVEVAARLD
jgi:DNA-binding SARP family transcriptional activator